MRRVAAVDDERKANRLAASDDGRDGKKSRFDSDPFDATSKSGQLGDSTELLSIP